LLERATGSCALGVPSGPPTAGGQPRPLHPHAGAIARPEGTRPLFNVGSRREQCGHMPNLVRAGSETRRAHIALSVGRHVPLMRMGCARSAQAATYTFCRVGSGAGCSKLSAISCRQYTLSKGMLPSTQAHAPLLRVGINYQRPSSHRHVLQGGVWGGAGYPLGVPAPAGCRGRVPSGRPGEFARRQPGPDTP
jgi:hypothetical protein